MRMRALVTCVYEDADVARAIASALRSDNLQAPEGVQVATTTRGRRVTTTLEVEGKMGTLLATLDDLLFCTSTAEDVI